MSLIPTRPSDHAGGASQHDGVDFLITMLADGNDVECCHAARALGAMKDPRAVPALIAATRQDDEDLRCDAIAALRQIGSADATEALMWSIENDPVGDAKIAAIEALSELGAQGVVPLLCELARDRCEDHVAWEDEDGGTWDDWLDVQRAAINALGLLGAQEGAAAVRQAADEEFAQDVWNEAVTAFARQGAAGLSMLIDTAGSPSARMRERTAHALHDLRDPRAVAILDVLVSDADPDVRAAAAQSFIAKHELGKLGCLFVDPDPRLRLLATQSDIPAARSVLMTLAFDDPADTVRIAALTRLADEKHSVERSQDLAAHIEQSLRGASEAVIVAMVGLLGALTGPEIAERLLEISAINATPLVRKAVLEALTRRHDPIALETLRASIGDENQMLRLAAISGLADLAGGNGDLADNASVLLTLAIAGKCAPPIAEGEESSAEDDSAKAAGPRFGAMASDDDKGANQRIRLDREGNIIEPERSDEARETRLADFKGDDVAAERIAEDPAQDADDMRSAEVESSNVVAFPGSTLGAILQTDETIADFAPEPVELSEGDLHFLGLAQETISKKRVIPGAVNSLALDIRIMAARLAGSLVRHDILDALVAVLDQNDADLRLTALDSLARLAEAGCLPTHQQMETLAALPPDHQAAARALLVRLAGMSDSEDATSIIQSGLEDAADTVRAVAIAARDHRSPGTDPSALLRDPARAVRKAAAAIACAQCRGDVLDEILDAATMEGGVLAKDIASFLQHFDPTIVRSKLLARCGERSVERLIVINMLPLVEPLLDHATA